MILVIDTDKQNAVTCAEIFNYMGILSYGVTPTEALAEIGLEYRAVLVSFPDRIADRDDFVKRLRSYCADIPIFALSDVPVKRADIFDATFGFDTLSSTLIKEMTEYCRLNKLPFAGSYRLAGFEASADGAEVLFKNERIPLTKTEKMILRYLIRTSPAPKCPADIIKHAFKQTRPPLESSIRTHVYQINKKLALVSGAPEIQSRKEGYVIATPLFFELEKEILGIV